MAVNASIVWIIILMCFSFFVVCVCLWRASENRLSLAAFQDLQVKVGAMELECGRLKKHVEKAEEDVRGFRKNLESLESALDGMKSGGAAEVVSALDAMKKLERSCAACELQWQAMAERLDAQGARVLELEHRVSVEKPTVPEA